MVPNHLGGEWEACRHMQAASAILWDDMHVLEDLQEWQGWTELKMYMLS